jgi:rod shape-determining protein MreC|tara:strand:- start:6387 stop:7211 length:825 start_codon:yes stop_codon:yes gene_type:complete
MKNIILLIQKYKNFLFFLFLEFIALFFLFSATNNYHHYNYLSSSNSISAGLFNLQYGMTSYFSLREINNQLLVENAKLKNQLLNKDLVVGRKYIKHKDTTYKKNYLFKEVRVINSQYKFYKNNLIINAGINSGVQIKSGLIGTKGLLGIVTNVSSNYASIRPIINPDFGLKVLHENSNSWGDLIWIPEQNSFNNVYVKNIPIYTEVKEGDFFITSGAEGLFPRGVIIGRTLSIKENIEKQTLNIKVKLEEDFSSLKVGFVVKNQFKNELDQHLN